MIVTSCPLRISLVGGSTDHPHFLEKYEEGSVISFPSNLNVYVTLHRDIFGANSLGKKYVINYSRREMVNSISEIENELVRNCLEYFEVEQINCTLTSDVYSIGSGLASSSAYLIALIKAIHTMRNIPIADMQACTYAHEIEKKFNPLVGQQDFYGSLPGLKRMWFYNNSSPVFKFLDESILDEFNMLLLYTGVTRASTTVLKSLDIDKCIHLLDEVDRLDASITRNDAEKFCKVIKDSWIKKKDTSPLICQDSEIQKIDNHLSSDPDVAAHKLCGAGNGGFFLIFQNKQDNALMQRLKFLGYNVKPIKISSVGIKSINLN